MIPDLSGLADAAPPVLLSAGLAIGLLHALEPDHLASVMTQSRTAARTHTQNATDGSILGLFWGLGHASSVAVVSVLVTVFAASIPAILFDSFEIAAGVVLVGLGVMICVRRPARDHSHVHAHANGTIHSHPHAHRGDHAHRHRSYLIGCVHGLAGSGSLVVLASVAFGSVQEVFYFLVLFGIGSTCGMMMASGMLAVPLAAARGMRRVGAFARIATGGIGVAIGLGMILFAYSHAVI